MFFGKQERETELTQAVIANDVGAVKEMSRRRDLVLAPNYLGFHSIDLARYLDRQECLQILSPHSQKKFKVRLRGESKIQTITEAEFEEVFRVRYLHHLVFGSYKLFKQVVRSCSNLFTTEADYQGKVTSEILRKYEFKPEIFTLRASYYGERIRSGYFAPVTIEWVDDLVQFGIYAGRDLRKGEYIGSYFGEMRRYAFWLQENEYSIFYPNKAWQTFLIDSAEKGNEMRFVNHSFKPNLDTKVASEHGLIHSLYFAARDIAKGEQLTWNYGEDFWSDREPPQEI